MNSDCHCSSMWYELSCTAVPIVVDHILEIKIKFDTYERVDSLYRRILIGERMIENDINTIDLT